MQCNDLYSKYFEVYPARSAHNHHNEEMVHCLFRRREPTMLVFAIYAFLVPSLALFGLCANFINAIVFMRPKMTPSAFTYLAALSWFDCLSCLFITLTAFSRSIFFDSSFWLAYDLQWQTPLFGITTGTANLILACVSFDRLVYLWCGIPNGTPRFCRRKVARRMIIAVICVSCIVNFPYFFVFVVNKDGTFHTTEFYYSHYYKIHNWLSFALLAILPAIFLLIGNAAILVAFRRWTKQSKKWERQRNNNNNNTNNACKTTQRRYQYQMKLTITILIVISLYLIGELPAHLTSRKSALNLLYSGDVTKVDFKLMQRLELICITLNAVQLSMNIMVYALINPSFMPEFFVCLRGASDSCFRFLGCMALSRFFERCCTRKERRVSDGVSQEEDNPSDDWTPPEKSNLKIESKPEYTKKKRSNSLGDFAFINHAMEYEIIDEPCTPKRHSMPTVCMKS